MVSLELTTKFYFIAMIRLPDFVTQDVFDWAIQKASEKKQLELHNVEFLSMQEGLCVQALHIGSYNDEPSIGTVPCQVYTLNNKN